MKRAYVQQEKGDWLNSSCYLAAQGFKSLGYDVVPFHADEAIPTSGPVYGDNGVIRRITGVKNTIFPDLMRYPHGLRRALDRIPAETTVEALAREVAVPGFRPVFIQPSRNPPLFAGRIVEGMGKLLDLDPETFVWRSPVTSFRSEYLLVMHQGQLLTATFQRGDLWTPLDLGALRRILGFAKSMPQSSFALRVGVAEFPERPEQIRTPTLLVGAYEIYETPTLNVSAEQVAEMSISRWAQVLPQKMEI